MSHLIKGNYNLLKSIRVFFYIVIFSLIFTGSYFYEGNKIIFFIFSIISNLIFLFIFSKKVYFFEIFFGGLLWLGFWYKSLIIVNLNNFRFKEGAGLYNYLDIENKVQVFDNCMIIVIYGFVGFLLACLLKNTLLFNFFNLKKKKLIFNPVNKNYIILLFSIFFLFWIIITFSNFYLGIYQRGILPSFKVHFTISAIYKWLLLFGFSTFIAFSFIFAFKKKSKIYILSTISIIETFVTNLSFLSRGMIFNLFAIFIGLYKSNKMYHLKLNVKFFLIYLLGILCFFYISVISVNYLRANIFFTKLNNTDLQKNIEEKKGKSSAQEQYQLMIYPKKYNTSKKAFEEFISLSQTRWVGIDALIAVETFDGKSFEFFKKSFKDEFSEKKYPFYEREVQKREWYPNNTIQYGITTPGIFAFLYYTGSKEFILFSIFLISLIIFTFEKFIFITFQNPILCSILSQVLAYRLIHFGYMPQNSYLLLSSILITIIGLFVINKIKLLYKN